MTLKLDKLLHGLRDGDLPLQIAVELSAPDALSDLWDRHLSAFHLVDAVELLLLTRHHEQLIDRVRRLPHLHHRVIEFYPPVHWSEWGEERDWARREVANWTARLVENSESAYPQGDAMGILRQAIRPLGPPSLAEIVAAAERQTELLRGAPP